MTDIDYDQLNKAAQMLYDAARVRGEVAGRDEAEHEFVEHTGRSMLGLAGRLLSTALAVDDGEMRRTLAQNARFIFGATPGGPTFDGGRLADKFDRVLGHRHVHASGSDINLDAARELRATLLAIGRGDA